MKMVRNAGIAATILAAAIGGASAEAGTPFDRAQVERGRYLVTIGGCNDCHTSGYLERSGAVPEHEWLTGMAVGYQGPWGTTYPSNLRLVASRMSAEEWVEHARKERLPPMPWFNLRAMTDSDLVAVYAYVRSLGTPGKPAPAYVAPGGRVTTPYFVFVPQQDDPQAATR
jgi:mono/diheme cytochrome c family protein